MTDISYPDASRHALTPYGRAHGQVQSLWRRTGWGSYFPVTMTIDGPNPGAFVKSVSGDRAIVTGPAATGNGNGRQLLLNRDFRAENSEVSSTWFGPSQLDNNATPQMGHVHRAVEISPGIWSAYVVTNNIAFGFYQTVNVNVWQNLPGGTDVVLGSNGLGKIYSATDRTLSIIAVNRFTGFGLWFNRYIVQPNHLYGMTTGDVVNIDADIDNTFDGTGISVNSVGADRGQIQVISPSATGVVNPKVETGFITPPPHKQWFPVNVKSQLLGTVLRVKVWRTTDMEPDWASTDHVGIFDTAGAGNPLPSVAAPTGAGFGGLVANHLRSGATLAYGDVTYSPL